MSSDDEHVGDVERVFIDSESHKATHFLISEGLLFKERKLIPTHWVRSVEEDKVHLVVRRVCWSVYQSINPKRFQSTVAGFLGSQILSISGVIVQ